MTETVPWRPRCLHDAEQVEGAAREADLPGTQTCVPDVGDNIAARVEALAKPGSVYVSETVHDQIADKVDFEDLGPRCG